MPAKHAPTTSKLTRKYTAKRFNNICEALANSDKGLARVCRKFKVAPSTFYSWLKVDKKLQEQYADAREQQAEFIADKIVEVANDDSKDILICPITNRKTLNPVSVQRAKLRVETYKWRIAQLSPKKYSNKKVIEIPGESSAFAIDWTSGGWKKAEMEDIKINGATATPETLNKLRSAYGE